MGPVEHVLNTATDYGLLAVGMDSHIHLTEILGLQQEALYLVRQLEV